MNASSSEERTDKLRPFAECCKKDASDECAENEVCVRKLGVCKCLHKCADNQVCVRKLGVCWCQHKCADNQVCVRELGVCWCLQKCPDAIICTKRSIAIRDWEVCVCSTTPAPKSTTPDPHTSSVTNALSTTKQSPTAASGKPTGSTTPAPKSTRPAHTSSVTTALSTTKQSSTAASGKTTGSTTPAPKSTTSAHTSSVTTLSTTKQSSTAASVKTTDSLVSDSRNHGGSERGGVIAGGVVGALLLAAILLGLGFLFYRRRKSRAKNEDNRTGGGESGKAQNEMENSAYNTVDYSAPDATVKIHDRSKGTLTNDYAYIHDTDITNPPQPPATYETVEPKDHYSHLMPKMPNLKMKKPQNAYDHTVNISGKPRLEKETDYNHLKPLTVNGGGDRRDNLDHYSKLVDTNKATGDDGYFVLERSETHEGTSPADPNSSDYKHLSDQEGLVNQYCPLNVDRSAINGGYYILEKSNEHVGDEAQPNKGGGVPNYFILEDTAPSVETVGLGASKSSLEENQDGRQENGFREKGDNSDANRGDTPNYFTLEDTAPRVNETDGLQVPKISLQENQDGGQQNSFSEKGDNSDANRGDAPDYFILEDTAPGVGTSGLQEPKSSLRDGGQENGFMEKGDNSDTGHETAGNDFCHTQSEPRDIDLAKGDYFVLEKEG